MNTQTLVVEGVILVGLAALGWLKQRAEQEAVQPELVPVRVKSDRPSPRRS